MRSRSQKRRSANLRSAVYCLIMGTLSVALSALFYWADAQTVDHTAHDCLARAYLFGMTGLAGLGLIGVSIACALEA